MNQVIIPFKLKMNNVVQSMIYADILFQSGWGLINPIIAVFITEQIHGGDIAVAGLAATIFMIAQSLTQLPISRLIDKEPGEIDDYKVMMIGNVMVAVSALLYIFATQPIDIYVIQILGGIGMGFIYPGWVAIFTRHIDKNKEGFEWSLYSTTVNLGTALTASIGGLAAIQFGFNYLFITVAIFSILSTIVLYGVHRNLRKK